MSNQSISELVLKAKGNRSYRQYQEDSKVDAAIIAKIVKGSYIPKNAEIYAKLAGCAENGVTFDELIDAAGKSKDYINGLTAGASIAQTAAATLGAVTLATTPTIGIIAGITGISVIANSAYQKKSIVKTEEYLNSAQRFCTMCNGILFSHLACRGIVFQQLVDDENRLFDNRLDTYLRISNQVYSDFIVRYLYLDKESITNLKLIEKATKMQVAELVLTEPNRLRKITIITEVKYAFDFLKQNIGKFSYRGNLTAILVDTKNVALVDEAVLTTYDETIKEENLLIM